MSLAHYLVLLCCGLGCASASSSSSSPLEWIRASSELGDRNFYDEHDRVRIFHGGNRVKKAFPWYFAEQLADDKEFELMKSMGFTVVRLGFMWSGVNPAPGVFNQTYVDIMKKIIGKMNANGIYALLDMHQDVLSSKFCLYDGVPLWVVNKSKSEHAFPWPLSGNCSSRGWMMNSLTFAAVQAFQDIYDNTNGMLNDLTTFWQFTAKQFKDTPGVIGYEIMNEPFAGNIYKNPLLLLPGEAGHLNLRRMHEAVAAGIREVDNRHLIFFEPVTWGMVLNGKIVGSGYTQVPGGPNYRNRSVFSYHYYCSTFDPSWQKHPASAVCDDVVGPLVFEAVKKDLDSIGGAQMMTEGLACPDSSSQWECHKVMQMLDQHLYSFTDYGYSQGDTYTIPEQQQQSWARTYARAVAGTPLNMTFDPVSKHFDFCFAMSPPAETASSAAAVTEIFASAKFSYPSGADITTTANVVATVAGDVVSLVPSSAFLGQLAASSAFAASATPSLSAAASSPAAVVDTTACVHIQPK